MATTVPSTCDPVEVYTTEPVHKNLEPFFSKRLLFRTLLDSDFTAYHVILSQEDTMTDAGVGPMPKENQARSWFKQTQETWTRVGIFLKKSDDTEGELIGEGGVYKLDNEWPEIFYLLKKEFWGNGYASEFVEKFKKIWWGLPRKPTRIFVQSISVDSSYPPLITERLCATIKTKNKISQKVVEKAGFDLRGKLQKEGEMYDFWQYISPN